MTMIDNEINVEKVILRTLDFFSLAVIVISLVVLVYGLFFDSSLQKDLLLIFKLGWIKIVVVFYEAVI